MAKKRVISGVQPSGNLTIGNYLGAMKQWPLLQGEGREVSYFVANLHALNLRPNAKDISENSLNVAAWLVAMGVNSDASNLFLESDIPQIPQFFTILNNYVTMGELSRMTQYKEKSDTHGQIAGLFEYPVLMAADILAFDIDLVPVGDDQRQHVEIARDIAERFNNSHGETFTVPEALIQENGARIMNLQNPDKKMSKSAQDSNSFILLEDNPDVIVKKISSAVTDSDNVLKVTGSNPAITNLLTIYSLAADKSINEVEESLSGKSYADFKKDVADVLVSVLKPIQQKYRELVSDKQKIRDILAEGKAKVEPIAQTKLAEVKEKIGLLTV